MFSFLGRQVSSTISRRCYITKAHARPRPQLQIMDALRVVLEGIEERNAKRTVNWDRNTEQRARKGKIKDDGGAYRNPDETIELALNLNLDPRKPGQALRGSVALPHGTGNRMSCAVFSSDPLICSTCLSGGATVAGGEELVDQIVQGTVPLTFDRALASQEMLGYLTKQLARVMGPRGLMPNAKVGTLVSRPDDLPIVLVSQMAGQLQYRTDKEGIVHMGVGKGSFGYDKLMDNIRIALEEIQTVKPELLGKGKKASKNAAYFLSAYMTATQGVGIKLDLRTVDPASSFFCTQVLE